MVENVQCPVCTLFLHAGMNLSDHLETHPKEQVIKALVQLTVSGGGGSGGIAACGVLKAAISGETKTEEQENSTSSKSENDMSRSNSRLSTISSSSSTLCSTNSSFNFGTSFTTHPLPTQNHENTDSKVPQNFSNETRVNNSAYEQHSTNSNDLYQNRASVSNDKHLNYNSNKPMNFSRYHQQQQLQQQQQQQQEQSHSHEQKIQQMQQTQHSTIPSQLQNAHEHHQHYHHHQHQHQHQTQSLSKQNNNIQQLNLHENRSIVTHQLPPPPPPLPAHRHQSQQSQQQQQQQHSSQQSQNESSTISATSTITFPTNQHGLYTSVGQQRSQHLQLEHQNVKNIFSGSTVLPPPPPLQLFSYQQSAQHQKPPPAYGAAISQIRSQQSQNQNRHQNQNKPHIPSPSPFLYSQAQHSHFQRHNTNNNNNPPRTMSHHVQLEQQTNSMPPSTHSSTLMKSSSSMPKHIVQERSFSSENIFTYDQRTTNDILKNQQLPQHQNNQNRQHQLLNTKCVDVTNVETQQGSNNNSSKNISAELTTEKLPPPPLLPTPSSLISKSSVTSHSSSVSISHCASVSSFSNRQASSPFTSLIAAPSPSSVLRYAESPVAHYLERDNGDFIVQETPKHIVECVEEEDGEFSVIERFHQSPPSVLHIHDDKDDNDEESRTDEPDRKTCSGSGSGSGSGSNLSSSDLAPKKRISKTSTIDHQSENQNENEQEFLSLKKTDNNDKDENVKRENNASSLNSTPASGSEGEASNSNSSSSNTKKSKNSITVLSDVQLNLNEYLDLVGNIIASSKIAKRRSNYAESMPVPLVKVEKVELPDDDEYDTAMDDSNARDLNLDRISENSTNNVSNELSTLTEPLSLSSSAAHQSKSKSQSQSHHQIASKKETGQILVEQHNNSKYDHKNSLKFKDVHVNNENENEQSKLYMNNHVTQMAGSSSSHVTSVIRMASTTVTLTTNELNQNQKQNHQNQNQSNEKSHHQENSTVMASSNNFAIDENATAQDLSQPQKFNKMSSSDEMGNFAKQDAYSSGILPPPTHRKGPKKLVIKPKSTKTEENAKNVDFNEPNVINESPTTSRSILSRRDNNISHTENSTLLTQSEDLIIKFEPSSYEIHNSNIINSELSEEHEQSSSNRSENREQSCENPDQNQTVQDQEENTINTECKREKVLHTDHTESNFIQSQCSVSDEAVDYRPIKCERLYTNNDNSNQNKEENSTRTTEKDSAAEDARVLLDFANSSKCTAGKVDTPSVGNFFSSHSLFSGCTSSKVSEHSNSSKTNVSNNGGVPNGSSIESSLRCEDEFIAVDEHELHDIITSTYSRSSMKETLRRENKQNSKTQSGTEFQQQQHLQQHQQQQQQQQPHSSFSEYPFSFFYNNGNGVDSLPMTTTNSANQFSSTYHQTPEATTTAATVASSSTLDDSISGSSPAESYPLNNRFGSVQGALPQWYQSATLVVNSDFESALSIDNAAVDGDVGKYLDLDACKRENSCSGVRMALSSTSSSFAVATDSSLPGGCTNDALNIRTDEKMPPKGEISEQESNCDIENSCSQPVYGEIPSKFYRTSFPGIFPQDNGWNHEEFFTVQDLSHSTNTAPITINNGKNTKNFEFHLPLESAQSTLANNNLQLLHDDVFPSTSLGIKKKRKRVSNDSANKSKPTATITSQQFLQNAQSATQHSIQNETQQQQQQQPKPTTSSAALMAAGTSSSSSSAAAATATAGSSSQTKPRKKVYKCPHCSIEFSKLRDRNSHMIDTHNYVRQNRRLISSQVTTNSVHNSVTNSSRNNNESVISANATLLTFGSHATSSSATLPSRGGEDFMLDSKHNIKIEMEYEQQGQAAINSHSTPSSLHQEMALQDGIQTKSEYIEEMGTMVDSKGIALTEDRKPNLNQTQSLTAPTSKLATLYRMLISYNISTLKQNQNLTDIDEKLIESSLFFCYICRSSFSSVKLYDAHLTEHPAECFTCGKKFQRWKNFSLHLKRHLGWKEFACTVCDKKFVVRSALVEHTRMHTGHTPLKCKVCGKSFKRYSNLTQHRKRHGRVHIRKKEYVCHCGEVLPSKARFLWHKEIHDSKPKCCPHCCDRFVHANSLRRHIRLAHSDKFDYAEPMECPMCKQVFAKSSIKAHMATHSVDTQHDCKICNKSFSTKWNLKIHLWVHANRTAKPFKCEHCPKAFVREVDFKNHMNSHKQIKPYTCEYCGCKFIRKYNYMRHRREHHGNKKFSCELCKKSFHRHYYLIEHRRIHTGERPFQCTICGKSSTTKTNHNKHLKIHHSRDPFTVET